MLSSTPSSSSSERDGIRLFTTDKAGRGLGGGAGEGGDVIFGVFCWDVLTSGGR